MSIYINELYHIGVKERSGRRPWGSGERPFQRLGGKKRKDISSKAKELTPEEINTLRENVKKPPISLREVQANKDYLTTQDLKDIKQRIDAERDIATLRAQEIEAGKKFIKGLDKAQKIAEKGMDYYATMKKIDAFIKDISGEEKKDPSFFRMNSGNNNKKKKK